MEQGLGTGEEAPMGDTPATRLRGGGGPGVEEVEVEEGEVLERELRHLETEEKETRRKHLYNHTSIILISIILKKEKYAFLSSFVLFINMPQFFTSITPFSLSNTL